MSAIRAYYPNLIREWPVHRDLLDDVQASHVNNIQAELNAMMLAIGTTPQIYNDIQTVWSPTVVTPGDEGGLVTGDIAFSPSTQYYDPARKTINYGSVGQRLDAIERGQQNHTFRLRASGIDMGSGSVAISDRPRAIRFPKPSNPENDPFDLHDGLGVRIRKSGFWVFNGNVVFNISGATAADRDGTFLATIDVDNTYTEGMNRKYESANFTNAPQYNGVVTLPVNLAGYYTRGTRISLRASHNTGSNQRITVAWLSGFLIRETIA